MISVSTRSSSQSPSLHPAAQLLSYLLTLAVHLPLGGPWHETSTSVGVLGQGAPHEMRTSQLFAETVQEAPLLLQTPADVPSEVERVQLQVPQGGGQPLATQASPLMLQMPSDVLSVVEAQMQAPQTGQPLVTQSSPLLLQTPAVASSKTEGVQLQSPQTGQPPPGTVQAAPPLLQVPAVASSKTEGVQLQEIGRAHV